MSRVLLLFVSLFFDAFALWCMWGWFIVPLGVVRISYWHAIGLDAIIGIAASAAITTYDDDPDRQFLLSLAKRIGVGLMLLIGLAIHSWAMPA